MNLPAVFILFALTMLLIRGTQESAFVNNLIVITKVSIVLMVITIGWGFMNPANHTPYIPAATTYVTPEGVIHNYGGIMGILGAAGVVFEEGDLLIVLRGAHHGHGFELKRGERIRIRYMTQAKARPPTFVLFGNQLTELPESYLRYLTHGLREAFNLPGTPIRLMLRSSKNPYKEKE